MSSANISIIIPTLGRRERKESLLRAIESVVGQENVIACPIVVLNGNEFDPEVRSALSSRSDLKLICEEECDLPKARYTGREMVDTEFFGFLDDDDYYLAGALSERLEEMMSEESLAAVVTNGIYSTKKGDRPYFDVFPDRGADPARELFRTNWLASSGGLFRTSLVTPDYFDLHQKFFEWTLTAFNLVSSDLKIRFLDQPHMVVCDTIGSLSKELSYYEEHPRLWKRLSESNTNPSFRDPIIRKLSASWHELASIYFRRGYRRASWKAHFQSLKSLYGIRYASYTRHLVFPRKLLAKQDFDSYQSDQ